MGNTQEAIKQITGGRPYVNKHIAARLLDRTPNAVIMLYKREHLRDVKKSKDNHLLFSVAEIIEKFWLFDN